MIRKYLIEQYITIGSQAIIFGHHGTIHFRAFRKTLFGLALLRGGSTLAFSFRGMASSWLNRSLTAIALLLYGYFLLQFLNNYLDALISSDRGITIFRWDGLLHYSVQQFEWDTIEMISFAQDSFGDRVRDKGDILINVNQDISFRIEDIAHPKKVSNMLRSTKAQYTKKTPPPPPSYEDDPDSHDKFNILVETLGEVIKDYMDKGKELPYRQY